MKRLSETHDGEVEGRIDPRTASVGFSYDDLGGGCFGRVYYWFDPSGELPAVDDHDLRTKFPHINDETWQILFCEAFHRGETSFEADLLAVWPDDLPIDNRTFHLGRIFGPRAHGARIAQAIFVPPGATLSKAEVLQRIRLDEENGETP